MHTHVYHANCLPSTKVITYKSEVTSSSLQSSPLSLQPTQPTWDVHIQSSTDSTKYAYFDPDGNKFGVGSISLGDNFTSNPTGRLRAIWQQIIVRYTC